MQFNYIIMRTHTYIYEHIFVWVEKNDSVDIYTYTCPMSFETVKRNEITAKKTATT